MSRNLEVGSKLLKSWVTLQDAGELKGSSGVIKLTPDQLRIGALAIAREEGDILKLKNSTEYFAKISM